MRDGVAIMPFNLDLAGTGNRPSALTLERQYGDDRPGVVSPIAANLETSATGRKVTLTSGDAGMLARGLFGFESMRGGQLSATVNLPGQASDLVNPSNPNPDFTGSLTVKDFTMVNQSLLARLFSAGSLTGFGDLMGGDGMTLDELNMPFSSKNNVISVNGARVRGPAIGASADGYIDRPKGMLALKGSLVPAYGVNSLISNVPLLGDILASKKGEGILSVTYSMTGNAEQPTITTNPLSILTPGILRRIFEGHIPTAANAPSNAQRGRRAAAGTERRRRIRPALRKTCFFLPLESFSTPSLLSAEASTINLGSDTAASFSLRPLLAISLRASEFDAARPAATARLRMPSGSFAVMVGRPSADGAFLKGAARGVAGFFGGVAAMQHGGGFGGQDLLGLVQFRALQCFQPRDFAPRHVGEQAQEAADIAVLGVAPELPIVIGAAHRRRSATPRRRRSCPSWRPRRW